MVVNRFVTMANVVIAFLLAVVNALESAVRCTFISFVSVTTPTMRKTNNPYFGRVQKRTTASGVLFNATYWGNDENGNPLPKEERGKEPLRWGAWRKWRKTIDHNGKVYMRCYFTRSSKVKTEYLVDGRLATETELAEISAYISKGGAPTYDAHGKMTRDYDLSNVVSLTINGKTYNKTDYDFSKVG